MAYREYIPDIIREKIHAWNLSPDLWRLLWSTLRDELRTRELRDFGRIEAPTRALVLPIELADPANGCARSFLFYIDIWTDPTLRGVVDAIDADAPICKPIPPDSDMPRPVKPEFEQ